MADTVVKSLEHGFKSIVLALLSVILRRGDVSRWPVDPAKVRSVLILRPDKLGDMIAPVNSFEYLRIQWRRFMPPPAQQGLQ